MASRKLPIRTYQRKIVKNLPMNLLTPAQVIAKYDLVEDAQKCFDKNKTPNESINYDPFETTFDRIAKEAVVPPLPPDIYQNDSWDGSSTDNDTNIVTNITFSGRDEFNLVTWNSTSSSIDRSIKLTHKYKKPQKYELNAVTSKRTLLKKTRATSTKPEIQSKTKAQKQKKQTSKARNRRKGMQNRSKEFSNMYNKQQNLICPKSGANSLKDVIREKNVPCSDNFEHSHEKILKTDRTTVAQITSDSLVTDLKYISSCLENVKPCFVKLDACSIQNWHALNNKGNMMDKKDMLYDTKLLRANKDISKVVDNIASQSISIEYNDIVGKFKNISLKSCSVVLCDNTVGNCSKKCINVSLDARDKSVVSNSVLRKSSKILSRRNSNIQRGICGTEKNSENMIKDSFVRMEKLKIEDFVRKGDVTFNEKERYMLVSSTPISTRVAPSTYSILFSPIATEDTHAETTHYKKRDCCMTTEDSISDIASSHKYPSKKIRLSIAQPENCKLDAADIQERQTQILLSSQNMPIIEDFPVKTETVSSEKDIHTALTQKYNTEYDVEMALPSSLNTSAGTDQSRSLFGDTTACSYNHPIRGTIKNEIKEKIDDEMVSFPVDLHSERKQLLSDNANPINASLQYKLPFKACMIFQNADSIIQPRQEQSDKAQGNVMVSFPENFKNGTIDDSKHSLLADDRDDTSIVSELRIQLQDPTKITTRRMRYSKQKHLDMPNTSESSNNKNMQLNDEIFHYIAGNEDSNIHQQSGVKNLERFKNMSSNTPFYQFPSLDSTQQCYSDNTNRQIQKSIFLKSGKSWTRSLSILNNINDECNLDKLSIGKGKKWRKSVRDLLDMQKQGSFESYFKKQNDDTDLPCAESDVSNISSVGVSKRKTFNSTNHMRFSKRISIRVVPNDTGVKHDVKDIPFLEAFGISVKGSLNSELSHWTRPATRDDPIRKHSTTAKDVVLKKCSQQCYLSFSECFPDSYLEHCRKIGEGVYGEVFLYDCNNKKSVIKIIPIEGKDLVNGEPQKKFNEILSEIVIAKELDNLRLNNIHRTNGFVEVKSIKCIIGRYPEKLIKLWNIYDEEKTSDNDSPLMFDENQLYISLELGHGGEDLEAFVFQTAKEACTLFFQIALALAVAEKALEFEHRDLHWGNVLISRTKDKYVYYNLDGKEIRVPSNGVKVSIIDFTLSRMLYEECYIYNDLALDPALFTAHGEYQFEIYRLMRDKIQDRDDLEPK